MKPKNNAPLSSNLILPSLAVSKAGEKFNPEDECWKISDGLQIFSLDFSQIPLGSLAMRGCKQAFVWYLENKAIGTCKSTHTRLKRFLSFLARDVDEITGTDILNYRASLPGDKSYLIGSLGAFLKKWHELNGIGISDSAIAIYAEMRTKINQRGEAVLTMDPLMGPFTEIEVQALHLALSERFKEGKLRSEDYCLAWIVMAFGMRPIQYAGMKISDIWLCGKGEDSEVVIIRMSRAKNRGKIRSEFLERKLIPKIGRLLQAHCDELRVKFQGILTNVDDAPMFPAKRNAEARSGLGFDFHISSSSMQKRIKEIFNSLHVVSERTGKPLNISPVRFRRTIGTRTAEEGHGLLIIAEILDHTDSQSAGIYIEATSKLINRIDKAVSLKLAPLAQAFKGMVLDGRNTIDSDIPYKSVRGPKQAGTFEPIGNCGSMNVCKLFAPIACYTCKSFMPWLDGPHEAVLKYLLNDRERISALSGNRIAAINDQTILAVSEVVKICDEKLRGRNE